MIYSFYPKGFRERGKIAVKKFLYKYASVFAALALVITTVNANSTCYCVMHQDRMPESAKKLRRF